MTPNAPAAWFSLDERAALSAIANGQLALQQFISDRIDFAAPINTVFNLSPALPGYLFLGVQINSFLVTTGGAAATAPSFSVGNDAGVQNIGASASMGAQFLAGFPNAPARGGNLGINNNNQKCIDLAARIQAKVTVQATGAGLVCFGYFVTTGVLLPSALT